MATPQELLRNKNAKAAPRANFRPGSGGQISGQFLDTAAKGLEAQRKRTEKADRDRAAFQQALLKNDLDVIRVASEAELADLDGVDAIQNSPKIREKYQADVKDRINKVPAKYRGSYDTQLAAHSSSGAFNKFSIKYTHSQARKVEEDTYNTRIANDMNDLVENVDNMSYVATEGIDKVEQSIRRKAERTYGDDPNVVLPSGLTTGQMIDTEVYTGVSQSLLGVITRQTSLNDFDSAEHTLNSLSEQITPADKAKAIKMIESGRKRQSTSDSIALGEDAFRISGGNLVEAERHILNMSGNDGEKFKKAMAHVQTKVDIRNKQKKKNEEKMFTDLYQGFTSTGQFNPEQMKALQKSNPEEADKLIELLNKNKGGPAVVTDQAAKRKITLEIDAMTDEDFAKVDINKSYAPYLSAKDRETLETRQRYVQKSIDTQYTHGQKYNASIPRSITKSFADSAGVFKDTPEYAAFSRMVEDKYNQIITENPKITESEIRKKMTREIRDKMVTVEDTSTFNGLFGEELEEVYTVPESLTTDRGARGSDRVRRIQSIRAKNGLRPYTESELEKFLESDR